MAPTPSTSAPPQRPQVPEPGAALRLLWAFAAGHPGLLAWSAGVALAAGILEAAGLLLVAPLVDALAPMDGRAGGALSRSLAGLLASAGLPAGLGGLLGLFLVLNLLRGLLLAAARVGLLRARYAAVRGLAFRVFADAFSAGWGFVAGSSRGALLNAFTREMGQVSEAFGAAASALGALAQACVCLAVPFYVSWRVSALCLAAALLAAAPFLLLGRWGLLLGRASVRTAGELTGAVDETLRAARVILGFGREGEALARLREAFDGHVRAALRSQAVVLGAPAVFHAFGAGVLVLALAASRLWGLPAAETAVVLYSMLKAMPLLAQLVGHWSELESRVPSCSQVAALGERARSLARRQGGAACSGLARGLALRGVSFAYPGAPRVLSGVDLELAKGSLVILSGPSGSGKSTLVDLLLGFLEPDAGAVEADGVSLNRLDLPAFHRRVGLAPQEGFLFRGTLRDNLLWAMPQAAESELRAACRDAAAEEFIARLPEGLDTVVGDGGEGLSAGQIQRLALARAFLRRPDLLVLDEATSCLDPPSEARVHQTLRRAAREAAVLVVTHRPAGLRGVGLHYRLEGGKAAAVDSLAASPPADVV